MRADIHPELKAASISCACGTVFETRSTAGSYSVDLCLACHPFYTGKQKLVDAEGRVERFRRRYSKAAK
mgnify:FL=1